MPEFILEIDGDVKRVTVDGDEIRIGRAEDNDIVLDDDRASRHHAVVKRESTGWVVQDLKSGNGTFVDGARAARMSLYRGAVIKISAAELTFLGGGVPDASAGAAAPEAAPTESAPEIAGRKVVSVLGDGVLTRDYEYIDDVTGAREMVRVVHASWLEGDTAWLEESVAFWSGVDHPNLARIDRIHHDEAVCLRERLAEETLYDRIKQAKGRMPQGDAVEYGVAVARALASLHGRNRVHGCVHPGLVRVYPDGPPRLAGPGVPREHLVRTPDDHMALLADLAPETFRPEGVVDERSDVFALGALLHHCLIGSAVSEGKTIEALEASASKGLFKTPKERRPTLVAGLSELIEHCLAVDRSERVGGVSEVLAGLESLVNAARARRPGGEVRLEAREREVGERPLQEPQRSAKSRRISWAITIGLLLIINVPIFLYFTGDEDKIPRSTHSGSQEPAVDAALRAVERTMNDHIAADRFDLAAKHVADAVAAGVISSDDASLLKARLLRRKRMRAMTLVDAVENALDAGDSVRAKSSLAMLKRVAGEGDPDCQRLAARIEGQ